MPDTRTSVTGIATINCLCLSTMRCKVPVAAAAGAVIHLVVEVAAGVAEVAEVAAAAAQVSKTFPVTPLHLQLVALKLKFR